MEGGAADCLLFQALAEDVKGPRLFLGYGKPIRLSCALLTRARCGQSGILPLRRQLQASLLPMTNCAARVRLGGGNQHEGCRRRIWLLYAHDGAQACHRRAL